jgi:hypothetical protein
MVKIRTCASCEQPTMTPVSREMQIYHSVYHYECNSCGQKLDMVPVASIGTGVATGGIALAFWGAILFHGAGTPSLMALGVYGTAILALAAIWVPQILKYRQCPAVHGQHEIGNIKSSAPTHLAARLIMVIERMGALAGFAAPIVIIVVILGAAALIGYINFTYFQ